MHGRAASQELDCELKRFLNARVDPEQRPLLGSASVAFLDDVAYVIFQEGSNEKEKPVWKLLLDWAVRTFSGKMAHCELLLAPAPEAAGEGKPAGRALFATYWGERSAWRTQDSRYHLSRTWRALPVFAAGAEQLLRAEADESLNTPYGYWRYLTSVRFVRVLACLLPRDRKARAHCATLTARALLNALPGSLHHCAAWYSPSTLYTELCERARSGGRQRGAQSYCDVSEAEAVAVHKLLFCAEESVPPDEDCRAAVRSLTLRACTALLCEEDCAEAQEQLARALLRWVCKPAIQV